MVDKDSDWKLIQADGADALRRTFKFPDFKAALDFTNNVGQLAEDANHHPDIKLGWGYVEVTLTTHSAHTVTDQDHQLATKIDKLIIVNS